MTIHAFLNTLNVGLETAKSSDKPKVSTLTSLGQNFSTVQNEILVQKVIYKKTFYQTFHRVEVMITAIDVFS